MAIDLTPGPPGYPRPATEYGEDGIPYYRMPPFLDPPEGVRILSFDEFQERGIQIRIEDTDEIELDGEGIPTVQLAVKHDLDSIPKAKKKVKKPKSAAAPQSKPAWYEDWAAGEDLRVYSYDQMLSLPERLEQAGREFKEHRTWPPRDTRVFEWCQSFLNFIGIADLNMRRRLVRHMDDLQNDDNRSDDENNDTSQPKGTVQPDSEAQASNVKVEEFNDSRHQVTGPMFSESQEEFEARLTRMIEAKERRVLAFISNPELATKIFFSSFFRDKGMLWERAALRDAPRVVIFFLNMLLRCRTLPELEKEVRAALKVAELAKEELPRTREIGYNVPDELGKSLTAAFGSRLRQIKWDDPSSSEGGDADQPEAKKMKLNEDTLDTARGKSDAGTNSNGAADVPVEVPTDSMDLDTDVTIIDGQKVEVITGIVASADVPMPAKETNGWGSSADGTGWDSADVNSWIDPPTYEGWKVPTHSLMALLGPTTLPLTRAVGYVEESTRWVSIVTIPSEVQEEDKELEATCSDLPKQFARVVLKPYKEFVDHKMGTIQPPFLVEDPSAKEQSASGEPEATTKSNDRLRQHDPMTDSITILLDPKIAKELLKGIGISGTFVQLVPNNSARDSSRSGRGRGRGRGRGGRSGAGSRDVDEEFWYPEKLTLVVPSFWTERKRIYEFSGETAEKK